MSLEETLDVMRKAIQEVKVRFLISQPTFTIKVVDAQGIRTVESF